MLLGSIQLSKFNDAIINFEIYLDLLHNNTYYTDPSIFNHTLDLYEVVYNKLYEIYYSIGDLDKALHYIGMVKSDRNVKAVMMKVAAIYIKKKDYIGLFDYYNENILINDKTNNINYFHSVLDKELEKLDDEEKIKVYDLFSRDSSIYSLLYKIRFEISSNSYELSSEWLSKIKELDFNNLPVSCADILYYLVKNNVSLCTYLEKVNQRGLDSLIGYISKKYDDFNEVMIHYLKNNRKENDIVNLRINKVIGKYLLIKDMSQLDFKDVWDNYLNDGISYIKKVYNPEIIDKELIYDTGNNEDAFFIYMAAAQKVKNTDKLNYIKCLRKALKVYPCMKNCIEILTREVEDSIENEKPQINSEFEVLKNTLKSNLKILLEAKSIWKLKL